MSRPKRHLRSSLGPGGQLLLLAPALVAGCVTDACARQPRSTRRILFLGDSITYAGLYVDYIEAYLLTRYPGQRFELINVGLPSETVSGLSEPGHAGGAFPRPCLHDRLDRIVEQAQPELALACYGMNDGIYYPLEEGRFDSFKKGIERLANRLEADEVPLVVLTPPVFDPLPLGKKVLPAGLRDYPGGSPYEGYDDVLTAYSEWLMAQRKRGWRVIDLHGPMKRHLSRRREQTPAFVLAADGVHPTPFGHWLMAQEALLGLETLGYLSLSNPPVRETAAAGDMRDVAVQQALAGFTLTAPRPMPLDLRWELRSVLLEGVHERFCPLKLSIAEAEGGAYRLYADEELVRTADVTELAAGVDLGPDLPPNRAESNARLLALIRQRRAVLTDAWLAATGHDRPGMPVGLPMQEAVSRARQLQEGIRELAAPMALQVRLVREVSSTPSSFAGDKSAYHGFDRYDFSIDGCGVIVVTPRQVARGKPWIWRAEFFDHRPQTDLALLAKGFHLVYIGVGNTFGCPSAMAHWDVLYHELTRKYGLSREPALEGLSRGGLYCYNWAAANPDKVACIYADAPVCDFKSWPGGKGDGAGSPADWEKLIADYGFTGEDDALAYTKNPIDNLEPLARAGVPLLHVYGTADSTVPPQENTAVVKQRYDELGGLIKLIPKPGVEHHPHGLDDPTPIVEFILEHTGQSKQDQ